jgi:Flp pilus assembly protein TadG
MSLLRLSFLARRMPKRFRRDETGVTAVEFALCAPIFFALMFMILETALHFFNGQLLDTAANEAGRLIMTGQVKSGPVTKAQYKQTLCDKLPAMFDCASQCEVDVRTTANFNSAALGSPLANPASWLSPTWDTGRGGDIVITRVYCQLPIYTDYFGAYMASNQLTTGKTLLMATTARRNEPFL